MLTEYEEMLEQWHDIWEFVIDNGNMSGMYKEGEKHEAL